MEQNLSPFTIIHTLQSCKVKLAGLEEEARQNWGAFYVLEPAYWLSNLRLRIEEIIADLHCYQQLFQQTINLN